jgi:hypothetical protein
LRGSEAARQYANSDFSFLRLRQGAGSLFQFVSQGQYATDRFVVADPMRELAVLIGLREKMADDLLLIHCALHLEQGDGAAKLFKFLSPLPSIYWGGSGNMELRRMTSRSPHQSSMSSASIRRLAFARVKSASVFVDGRRLRRPRLLEFRQVATGQDCQEAMRHGALKRGRAISGTDVTHFFGLSRKVGQRRPDCRGVSVREISNGSPGWSGVSALRHCIYVSFRIFDCVIPRFDTPAFKRYCLSCCDDPSQLSALLSVSKDSPRAPEAASR